MVKNFELKFELKLKQNFWSTFEVSPIMKEFLILDHVSILLISEVMAIWKL